MVQAAVSVHVCSFLAMLMAKQLEEEIVDSAPKTKLNKERRVYSLLIIEVSLQNLAS